MKCAIMQPTYLSWPGYFSLIDEADVFVILDNVKLEKHSWHVRNKIKTANGEIYLTIPVNATKGRLHTMINEARMDNKIDWRCLHLRSLFLSYKKAEYFNEIYPFVESLIKFDTDNLAEFTTNIIKKISQKIGIKSKFMIASSLKDINGVKDERLVSICRKIHCNTYISPRGSASYIEQKKPGGAFPENGIHLYYQNYESPIYKQLFPPFIPYLSIIDMLFNCGFKKALNIVRSDRKKYYDHLTYRREFLKMES